MYTEVPCRDLNLCILDVVSGGSADWTYGAEKIKYSYGVELRDTGK
jgi:hypothetical protein